MLLSIGLPVAIIFAIVAGIVLYVVDQSITEIKVNELSARSESVSNQIEAYFTKYLEDASQLSTNPEIQNLFSQVTPGVGITSTANFPEIKQHLDNVAASDQDNIQVAWIADVDSSQFTQSDGVVSDSTYDINARPWFKELVAQKKVFISEPYVDITTQKIIVSVVAPVFKPGTQELVGATCVDVSIDRIKEIIAENKIGEAGFFVVSTNSGMVFDHPNVDYNNGKLTDTDMSENIIAALMDKTTGSITYSTGGTENRGYVTEIGDTGWVLATGLPTTEFNEAFWTGTSGHCGNHRRVNKELHPSHYPSGQSR
jgi:methyl-accepting chemotaxis protein